MSTIFWFSGTGNSLYAVKRLSAELAHLSRKTPKTPINSRFNIFVGDYKVSITETTGSGKERTASLSKMS
jgi:hypothetical protein